MLPRRVQPEILDSLPPDHPDAVHNRRDLRFFNALMGNYRWMAKVLGANLRPRDRILELGAGEGDLGRYLQRRIYRERAQQVCAPASDARACRGADLLRPPSHTPPGSSLNPSPPPYSGLDLWPRPTSWPATWSWHRHDLAKFSHYADHSVIIGNLILHQFEDNLLAALGRQWRTHARLLIFCEPARSNLHLAQLPLARLAGINYVSRHDARVSIQGGFHARELPQLLGLDTPPWRIALHRTFLGAYRLVALREC